MKFVDEISFFEYLNFGDSERVHSEFLMWLLSGKSNVITKKESIRLLENLFDIQGTKEIIKIGTEVEKIDIFIETNNHILIIENKLKSSQHSNQLNRYLEFTNKKFPDKSKIFIFLSLIKEQNFSSDWNHISYSKILHEITKLRIKDKRHKVYIEDYKLYLNNLLSLLDEVCANPTNLEFVFTNGGMRKSEKLKLTFNNRKKEFITKNQLETVFQRAYLTHTIGNQLTEKFYISETRGTGLIDIILKENISIGTKKTYRTFIQIQGQTIKFAFSIENNYKNSKVKWINEVVDIFKIYKDKGLHNYKRCNSRKLAYVSLSKRMETPYWKLKKDDFLNLVKEEVKNGHQISKKLLEEIN